MGKKASSKAARTRRSIGAEGSTIKRTIKDYRKTLRKLA